MTSRFNNSDDSMADNKTITIIGSAFGGATSFIQEFASIEHYTNDVTSSDVVSSDTQM